MVRDTEDPSRAHPRTYRMDLRGTAVLLLGTIKGLSSERAIVRKTFEEHRPELIGLHIGREELKGLKAVVELQITETPMSSYEVIYARKLSKYGEVQIPPPSLVEAFRIHKEYNVDLHPLDFDDAEHSDIYTKEIDGMSMVRQSLRLKRVNRMRFDLPTPEAFCIKWDHVSNRIAAYRHLEQRREGRMAESIVNLAKGSGRQLHVLEYERLPAIAALVSGKV